MNKDLFWSKRGFWLVGLVAVLLLLSSANAWAQG